MGRTLPSTTQLAFELIIELKPFYDALRLNDQLILDKFFESTLQHRTAIDHAKNLLPMEVMPFAIQLEERKRNNNFIIEIYSQIEELDKRLIELLPPDLGWIDEF